MSKSSIFPISDLAFQIASCLYIFPNSKLPLRNKPMCNPNKVGKIEVLDLTHETIEKKPHNINPVMI